MKTQLTVSRLIENRIAERIGKGKIILIFGPRQSGKTTLMRAVGELFSWRSG